MNNPDVVERWFAHADLDHPLMEWLTVFALSTRER